MARTQRKRERMGWTRSLNEGLESNLSMRYHLDFHQARRTSVRATLGRRGGQRVWLPAAGIDPEGGFSRSGRRRGDARLQSTRSIHSKNTKIAPRAWPLVAAMP
jgi:hypothetical protein